jgi:hypothetical protein
MARDTCLRLIEIIKNEFGENNTRNEANYQMLAEIFFEKKDYENSKKNYLKALQIIRINFDDYHLKNAEIHY